MVPMVPPPPLLLVLLQPPPPPAKRLRSSGAAAGAPGAAGESSGEETAARSEGDMHDDVGSLLLSSDRPTNCRDGEDDDALTVPLCGGGGSCPCTAPPFPDTAAAAATAIGPALLAGTAGAALLRSPPPPLPSELSMVLLSSLLSSSLPRVLPLAFKCTPTSSSTTLLRPPLSDKSLGRRSIVSDDGCAAAGGVGAVERTGVEPAATIAAAASALRPSRIHSCRIAPRTEIRCGAYGSRSETRRSLIDAEKCAGKNHEG